MRVEDIASGRSDPDFPWDRLTGEPLIYASMGTLQNGLEGVFSTIAQAVGERAGMQLVLSIGPVLDPRQIKSGRMFASRILPPSKGQYDGNP
jgi:UDP:flavonoid glycosyltransferase YjiC (YdhE family)